MGEDAGRAGVGAGMGIAPRPFVAPVAESLSIGSGIDEAGYPVMAGARSQVGSGQAQQQVYRVVPGMGREGEEGRLLADRMQQVSISSASSSQPNIYPPRPARPSSDPRPAISSQASLQPARNLSQGGSISSIRSASTTRTTSSSNESALNLRQHYIADPANVHTNSQARTANGAGQNPLLDLLSSEREYAEQMTCIVRVSPQGGVALSCESLLKLSIGQQKVAAAWSRNHLPPSLLDRMFRAIEGVYKISKSLVQVREAGNCFAFVQADAWLVNRSLKSWEAMLRRQRRWGIS